MNEIHTGDCFDVLPDLEDESAHACVTDPPYGLAFMGRDWDDFEPKEYQDWCEEWATEVKRVLKPGAHLIAFSGNRTHHRLFTGVEDAGFEIRDTLTWHYGSGFPKAMDVSKAIDKANDIEREAVGTEAVDVGMQGGSMHAGREQNVVEREKTVATSDAAKGWIGWKTALKPATEFIVLARKPLGEDTIAENVQAHGTGALNIGDTRIEGVDGSGFWPGSDTEYTGRHALEDSITGGDKNEAGRHPANVIFDEAAAASLDSEVGESDGGAYRLNEEVRTGDRSDIDGYERKNGHILEDNESSMVRQYGDSGGPSRYFYTSKASRSERTEDGQIENAHPTVKPIDLMEWLVTLVTAESHVVLDPFCGSGTTCKAAKGLGRRFVAIEQQAKWADVARARCGLTPDEPSRLREDTQGGLEQYHGNR